MEPARPENQEHSGSPAGDPERDDSPFGGPPWRRRWEHPERYRRWHGGPPPWDGKRRFLFRRFAGFLAFVLLAFTGVIGALAFALTRLFGGDREITLLVWTAGCGLSLAFPLLAGTLAVRTFRRYADPLAQVMAAADQVAGGDLDVRVPEGAPGEIGRLATSFNHMVAELERSDRLRRDLTADVAHELRTPLHILQGNLEAIQDGVYTPTPEQIELLLDETRQLSRLVEDLRTLSLAEAGQLELVQAPVSLAELVQDALTSFSAPAEAAGVRLLAEIEPEAAQTTVSGDAGRLDQVLGNLLGNALRHTPEGGTVTVRLERAGGAVRLQVCDNGEGISPDDLPYVFDRFWRGKRSASPASGSGLGLAIARQLVQAHGGTIRAENRAEGGAVFTVELPVGG